MAADGKVVNFKELARLSGVSLPTLTALVDRHEDFPIEVRGGRGRPYRFNARKAVQFLKSLDAARVKEVGARDSATEQARLRLIGDDAPGDETVGLSPRERGIELENARRAAALSETRRQLVRASELEDCVEQALTVFKSELLDLPNVLARELDLTPETREALTGGIEAALRRCVERLESVYGEAEPGEAATV